MNGAFFPFGKVTRHSRVVAATKFLIKLLFSLTFTKEIFYNFAMFGIKIISPEKIVAIRGKRPRSEIVKNSGEMFCEQDLYNWEKGLNLPRPAKLPYLLKGLNANFDDISVEMQTEATV